jgi:TP901 family phage tail tape measure protein
MLAANTTTLNASDATEAITAAMKVYGREGESTLRFLDSWTEVEARHAITSMDLANGLKKAAAVAKTSGVSFDELNAIITGIGETSRQTGKEIGTSLRFMFRRMQADKGPKELGKVGIPVLAPTGELRKGFDILGDLAGAWDTLTSSQRLNLAQSIGGST